MTASRLPRSWIVKLFSFLPELLGTEAEKEAIYRQWGEDLAHLSRQELAVGAAHLRLRKESGTMTDVPTSRQFIEWCHPIPVVEKTPLKRASHVHAAADLRWAHRIMERLKQPKHGLPMISIQWAREVLGIE